jgi:TM2 domain-containing membrane protein YozV
MPDDASSGRKSVGLAALYSLILPGMGELYTGGFSSGKYFLMAEGVFWLGYISFDVYGDLLRSDARAFAAVHAGLDPSGKNDQFYVDAGNFPDTYSYNDKKLRDRTPQKVYDVSAGYWWRWDSDQSRATFRDQRIRSETMYNNRKFVGAFLLLNRLASAINAGRLAIAHNRALEAEAVNLRFGAELLGGWWHPHGVALTVTRTF